MVVLLSQTQQSPEVLYGGFSGRGKHALEELPPLSQTRTEKIPHVPSLLIDLLIIFDHVSAVSVHFSVNPKITKSFSSWTHMCVMSKLDRLKSLPEISTRPCLPGRELGSW
jgi:hypothetical protein